MSTPENFTAQLQKYKVKFKHQVQDDYMKNFCISQPITGQFENHHLKWNSGTKVQFQNDYSKKFHISQLITAHLPKSSTNRVKQVNFFGAGIFWNWLLKSSRKFHTQRCILMKTKWMEKTGPIFLWDELDLKNRFPKETFERKIKELKRFFYVSEFVF